MAFEELLAKIYLLLNDMENQPHDAHEILEKIHLELNQLKATGQPLPEDLIELERQFLESCPSPRTFRTCQGIGESARWR